MTIYRTLAALKGPPNAALHCAVHPDGSYEWAATLPEGAQSYGTCETDASGQVVTVSRGLLEAIRRDDQSHLLHAWDEIEDALGSWYTGCPTLDVRAVVAECRALKELLTP